MQHTAEGGCTNNDNKAIRDGKYLALPQSPIKIENLDFFFRYVISLLARVFIFLIDRATEEVAIKNIWKTLSVKFLRYIGSLPTDEAWRHALTLHYICIWSALTYRDVYNSL